MDYFLPTVACHNSRSGLDEVDSTVISKIDRTGSSRRESNHNSTDSISILKYDTESNYHCAWILRRQILDDE